MEDFKHYTVMKNEAVDALNCTNGKIYVDCTLGGGGHSELIAQKISPNGRLISFDIDDSYAINMVQFIGQVYIQERCGNIMWLWRVKR